MPGGLLEVGIALGAAAVAGAWLGLVRPALQLRREAAAMRATLRPGDVVLLAAGIVATVLKTEGDVLTCDIGAGRVKVLRSAIAGRWPGSRVA